MNNVCHVSQVLTLQNCISGVMVGVLISKAIDCDIDPLSCQTKDYKIGIYCFSAKRTTLRSQTKDWLAQNQNNVSEWSDMSPPWTVVAVRYHYKIQLQYKHVGLVKS